MSKIIILVGPPGAGKTTLAKQYESEEMTRISQDDQKKEHLDIFHQAIKDGKSIVIDRLNFNKQQRLRYIEPAKKLGYETEIIVLHENRKTCLERCEKRNQHPTIKTEEDRLSAINMFFSKYERPTEDEADTIQFVYPQKQASPATIICDIDNTLSDATHREHHVQGPKKKWGLFFDEMSKDPVNKWCKDLVNNLRSKHIIVLCSGRPDSYREITKNWVESNKVMYDELFMRPRSDSRSDTIVKEILLDFEILTRYSDIVFCIDDRRSVIDMYRSRGLTVLDCAGNTF